MGKPTLTASIGATMAALNTTHPTPPTISSAYSALERAGGFRTVNEVTIDGNGAQNDDIFEVIGSVEVLRIVAECIAVTGANGSTTCGTCYFDLFDGGSTEITDNGGTDLAGIKAGGVICKDDLANVALTYSNNASAVFKDGGGSGYFTTFCPFRVVAKSGAPTYIRFNFTGDADTNITMNFIVDYFQISSDGEVVAV